MSDLATQSQTLVSRAIAASLQGLADTSRRVYGARITAFLAWSKGETTCKEDIKRQRSPVTELIHHNGPESHTRHNAKQEQVTVLIVTDTCTTRAGLTTAPGATIISENPNTAHTLDRETVRRYMRALELQGSGAHVRNQSLAALKRLATEAGELGWISNEQALQISRIKARKVSGVRTGRWLDAQQCTALLKTPDRSTLSGRRDACVLALLLGCGLRRAEACALTHMQVRTLKDGKVLLQNLVGKGGRIRSVAVPRWAQKDIQEWLKETAQ